MGCDRGRGEGLQRRIAWRTERSAYKRAAMRYTYNIYDMYVRWPVQGSGGGYGDVRTDSGG